MQIELSLFPVDANIVPSGEKQTEQTDDLYFSKIVFIFPVLTSQRIIELVLLPDANEVQSGEKQTDLIKLL